MIFFVILAGCERPPPPDCETSDEVACFSGIYRTLVGSRVEGVVTCAPELDGIACVSSDDDGGWKLEGLPPNTDVLITAEHEDYVPVVYPQHTSKDWYAWYKTAVPAWVIESNADRMGMSLDPDRGHLLFITWEGLNIDGEDTPNVEGVRATLSEDAVLFYANDLGLADPDLEATGGLGQGGAINLAPGVYDLQLTAPAGPCVEHSFSWMMDADGTIPVPIRAGYTTSIDIICPAP